MKLSDELQQVHDCGDCGDCHAELPDKARDLETFIKRLSGRCKLLQAKIKILETKNEALENELLFGKYQITKG